MKRSFVFSIGLVLISSVTWGKVSGSDTLRITSTSEMYNVASAWAAEYNTSSKDMKVKITLASDNTQAEENIRRGMLGILSGNSEIIRNESSWNTIVGRDVIVPVINRKNPVFEKISKSGVSGEMLSKIFSSKEGLTWDYIVPGGKKETINLYMTNDELVTNMISAFLGAKVSNDAGNIVENSNSLISAILNDPDGLGFCRLTAVIDKNTQTLLNGLCFLPIDRNGNGTLDAGENIYSDYNQFARGVWIGKYPKTLYSNIYATCINQPADDASMGFLKWILTDGQKFLYEKGYNDLLLTERQKAVDQLYEAKVYTADVAETRSPFVVWSIVLICAIIILFTANKLTGYLKRAGTISSLQITESDKVFGESAVIIPQGLYFDKTHTWAFMEQTGMVKVGIDDFLQHVTGTITRVKMKKDGSKVKKGDQILSLIQNGKNLDLYAPVSGVIREHNAVLETNSGLINSSPYNEGWIYRIEPSNWHRENQLLFYAEKYRQYLNQEFTRLKDFMASVLNTGNKEYSHVILQDGGELRDGILSQMGPEVWDDFQTKYIDPSRQIWFYELF
jgi:glycine cleavage system H lipoate-binding protein/ABC-type phosphate transport system substrate-binding protein